MATNYLSSIGIDPPANLGDILRHLTLWEASTLLAKEFNLERTADNVYTDMQSLLLEYYGGKFELKPYVPEILEELKERNTRIALATATDEHLASMILEKHKISHYFEFIQTHQNTGLHKGQPEFFQIIIEKLQLNPKDIWMFEDALYSIETAKRCGLNVVAIRDESALLDLEEIKKLADIYVEDFTQLVVEEL